MKTNAWIKSLTEATSLIALATLVKDARFTGWAMELQTLETLLGGRKESLLYVREHEEAISKLEPPILMAAYDFIRREREDTEQALQDVDSAVTHGLKHMVISLTKETPSNQIEINEYWLVIEALKKIVTKAMVSDLSLSFRMTNRHMADSLSATAKIFKNLSAYPFTLSLDLEALESLGQMDIEVPLTYFKGKTQFLELSPSAVLSTEKLTWLMEVQSHLQLLFPFGQEPHHLWTSYVDVLSPKVEVVRQSQNSQNAKKQKKSESLVHPF